LGLAEGKGARRNPGKNNPKGGQHGELWVKGGPLEMPSPPVHAQTDAFKGQSVKY